MRFKGTEVRVGDRAAGTIVGAPEDSVITFSVAKISKVGIAAIGIFTREFFTLTEAMVVRLKIERRAKRAVAEASKGEFAHGQMLLTDRRGTLERGAVIAAHGLALALKLPDGTLVACGHEDVRHECVLRYCSCCACRKEAER